MHRAPFNLFIRGAAASVSSVCALCRSVHAPYARLSLLCAVLWAPMIIREPARVIFHGRPAPSLCRACSALHPRDGRAAAGEGTGAGRPASESDPSFRCSLSVPGTHEIAAHGKRTNFFF
jgi:hypothetical protein